MPTSPSPRPAKRPNPTGGSSGPNPTGGSAPLPNPSGSRPIPTPTGGSRPVPTGGSAPLPTPTGNKMQTKTNKLLMDAAQLNELRNALRFVNLYVNSRHLEMLSPAPVGSLHSTTVCPLDAVHRSYTGISVCKVSKLMFNEEENAFEKLVSVYSALNSYGGMAAMILQSDGNQVDLYLCTNTSGSGDIAGKLLMGNLKGQFPGCELQLLSEADKKSLLDSCGMAGSLSAGRTVRSLSMIPSRREDEQQHDRQFSAQGCEKFIDAMTGRRYTLMVLSQCVSPDAIDQRLEGLEALYSALSPYAKESVSYGENESDSVSYAMSSTVNNTVGRSISQSFGSSHTSSINSGHSTNRGRSYEFFGSHMSSGDGTSHGTSSSNTSNTGSSTTDNTSDSFGTSDSQTTGTTTGSTRTINLNRDNKAVIGMLEQLEEHIKRIQQSQTFGMWSSACYLIADDVPTAAMGISTLSSLLAGDSGAAPRAYCNQWDAKNPTERAKVLDYLQHLRHPVVELTMMQEITDASGATTIKPYQTEQMTPAMMISGREVPLMMSLPRKSVPGIVVGEMAEFGRNISAQWKAKAKRPVHFGNIYHMGQPEKTQVCIDLDAMASHTFICGAPGSGKSNTTYQLLQKLIDNKIPFLVIEPAKGEYKTEFAGLPNVNIFTVEESAQRLLQINPLEFHPKIHIREHLDNIIQVVSACWPLYGAMPGLLKQAFEQVYIDHGWDLEHSERILARGSKFPVFRDLIPVLNRIIDNCPYSAQTKGDYKGALLNRITSLCNGFEGQIFKSSIGVPDRVLFGENTIVDLSGIGSEETRSLLMGVMIIKLRNWRKVTYTGPNSPLIHATVLEEAHNILKRCSKETGVESGNIQGAAVGRLCDSIAEMRSAGEGFLIIDQTPSAVDEAAIKQTAIKIVMRLPAKDDCEEMGAALSLNENQIKELSRLDVGVAAMFHPGWTDTVLAKMGDIWDQRYRVKTAPVVDAGTMTKVQGAVVQLLYQAWLQGNLRNVAYELDDLMEVLCEGTGAVKPALPKAKQQEILDQVQVFLQDNDHAIRTGNKRNLKDPLAAFILSFLRLDGVMRVFSPFDVEPKVYLDVKEIPKKQVLAAVRWEKALRGGICRYLYMPEECEPAKAYRWPVDGTDSELFWDVYQSILAEYGDSFAPNGQYRAAYQILVHIDHFTDCAGGKKK